MRCSMSGDEGPSPARIVEARSDIDAFKRALAGLPARPRDVLRSIAVEGRSPHDVADPPRRQRANRRKRFELALSHCASGLP